MIKHGPILYFLYCVSGHSVSSLLLILAFFSVRKTFKSEKKASIITTKGICQWKV